MELNIDMLSVGMGPMDILARESKDRARAIQETKYTEQNYKRNEKLDAIFDRWDALSEKEYKKKRILREMENEEFASWKAEGETYE